MYRSKNIAGTTELDNPFQNGLSMLSSGVGLGLSVRGFWVSEERLLLVDCFVGYVSKEDRIGE